MSLDDPLLSRFTGIVGSRYALTDPEDQKPYLSEPRNLWHGRTPVVLRPGTVEEVSAILALANETGTPVVPQSGNTGLVGGQTPHEGGAEILLSLERLDRIRATDPQGNTMTVEAGVILADAQAAATAAGRLFPLSLAAEGSCRVGGNLATNAGGTAVLAYGNMRDLTLGLEVVLADGRLWNGLRALRKDNTGYDLKHLFIGSEGTLGVITAAVLKLFPQPKETVTAIAGVPDAAAAIELFARAREMAGPQVTTCELISRTGIEFVLRHGSEVRDPLAATHPFYVLLELTTPLENAGLRETAEAVLMAGHEAGAVSDAAVAESVGQAQELWRLRELLPEVQRHEGGSIKHDLSVPIAAIPELIDKASAALARLIPGCRPLPFGHIGDGNIHFNVSQPEGADARVFLDRWDEVAEVVHDITLQLGGSISAEHGIGRLKRPLMKRIKDPVELDMMREIKRTLDPQAILNPGRLL